MPSGIKSKNNHIFITNALNWYSRYCQLVWKTTCLLTPCNSSLILISVEGWGIFTGNGYISIFLPTGKTSETTSVLHEHRVLKVDKATGTSPPTTPAISALEELPVLQESTINHHKPTETHSASAQLLLEMKFLQEENKALKEQVSKYAILCAEHMPKQRTSNSIHVIVLYFSFIHRLDLPWDRLVFGLLVSFRFICMLQGSCWSKAFSPLYSVTLTNKGSQISRELCQSPYMC